ncbi:phage major capsid protein [Rhodobacter sp. KR11]|uniref:phage major capsid protein n=1 Tax=Rhodobacter sp. KR11 TaxID=2974588 RepID=UPI002223368A|nr:phage major capsid protein [Rhodobacter sp. KR11]MCW1919976.1 phage major capsid protein [Rhodobacter sp. KR11]
MTDQLELKASLTVTEAGEITGLAWPFGSSDRVGDVIEKGAFDTTPATLPMLFAHDQGQVIGVWDQIAETPEGLTVKGRLLIEEVERAREVRAMIKAGAVSGLSIGFVTKSAKPRQRGRTITALDLHEVSIVAVPAHPGAQITSVKSVTSETVMENNDPKTPANAPDIDTKAFDLIRERLDKLEAKGNRPGVQITGPNPDKADRKAFVSYLRRGVERISPDEIKALTVASDPNGGFLAPEEFGNEVLKKLIEYSPIRAYANVIQISASEIKYPRRLTGTAATWVNETDARTASGMTFEQVTITPQELATFTEVSNALLEDNSYNLEGELLNDFAESFGKAEGFALVKGTGTGQPKGLMVASGITEVKTGVAASFPASNPADVLIAAYHKLPTTYAQRGVWMMNRNTMAVVRTWKDSTGRYLMLDPISANAPTTLLGRPVVEMLDMDDIGAGLFPIIFGDMSGYRIVDRIGLTTLRDPYSLATVGQVRFHARKRVGADLTNPDRFVKIKVAA